MRWLALIGLILLPVPALATDFIRSYDPFIDTYLDQGAESSSFSDAPTIYVQASDTCTEMAAALQFAFDSLSTGEVFDSARVVVWSVGSSLYEFDVWTHLCLRTFTSAATWARYAVDSYWTAPGAWDATDVDLSSDYGYGANGRLNVLTIPGMASPPESLTVARGAAFSAIIESRLTTTGSISLILHADPADPLGNYPMDAYGGDNIAPKLRIYGHGTVTPRGACCFGDGSCVVHTEADCGTASGTYQGDDTVCDPNPCDQPTGACCFDDGSCIVYTSAACSVANGTYQGNGTDCDPNPCDQPTGACCATDGTCTITTDVNCADEWTVYGDCDPNICTQPTGSCCYFDGTCEVTLELACMGGWTMFAVCDPNPCTQPLRARRRIMMERY